jgi:hypothetical protein
MYGRVRTAWKTFAVIGGAVSTADAYHQGYRGKDLRLTDFGPQGIPKILGRLHHGYNIEQQMKGDWERNRARLDAIRDTPPLTTNYPKHPTF